MAGYQMQFSRLRLMRNYSVEVQCSDGTWRQSTVWACAPNCFRELLSYIKGGSTIRIRRTEEKPSFTWPEDKHEIL